MIRWINRSLFPVLTRTWQGWQKDDGFLLSAAMAYYAAFSLFPLVLVLISVLGLVLKHSSLAADAQEQLLHVVGRQAGPWMAEQLRTLLTGVRSNVAMNGPLGIITLTAAAIVVFLQLDYMFERIWGTNRNAKTTKWWGYLQTALFDRLAAFVMLLAVGVALVAVFLSNVVLSGIHAQVEKLPAGAALWASTHVPFTIFTNTLLLGVIYRVLPRAPVRWREALAGGLLVSAVWFIGQRLLISFVIGTGYTAYGLVGSFIATMIWLYYVSAVLFFGAEFVQALHPVPGEVRDKALG